jgi:putative ABC transport system permease protein
MNLREAVRISTRALSANPLRTMLTALGLVIGNASVILVVTISLTSTDLILEQIRGIGSNVIWGYYPGGNSIDRQVQADFVKLDDVEAIRKQFAGRIVAATAVMPLADRIVVDGQEREVALQGADQYYPVVRNLVLLRGRFLDEQEVTQRIKVALLTEELAKELYGSAANAIDQVIKFKGLRFQVVGVFKEKVSSFGLSELQGRTALIPITVLRYFTPTERIDPFYVQTRRPEDVIPMTGEIRQLLENRHRPGARYFVDNLGAILATAEQIGVILTIVLIIVALIALAISGIGIMNIMLVTVTERTKEVGLRMAIGASRREVMLQFLMEATLISVGGGLIGMVIGLAIPLVGRAFAEGIAIRISWLSVAVAFLVSFGVGLLFGYLPAKRASSLSPTEALRYE